MDKKIWIVGDKILNQKTGEKNGNEGNVWSKMGVKDFLFENLWN